MKKYENSKLLKLSLYTCLFNPILLNTKINNYLLSAHLTKIKDNITINVAFLFIMKRKGSIAIIQ